MELWKIAIIVRRSKGEGWEAYPPKYLRLVVWKWVIEFRFGCVKDSLKALETIQAGGKP